MVAMGMKFLLFLVCVAHFLALANPLAQYEEPRNYALYVGGDFPAGVRKWNDRKQWVELPVPTAEGSRLGNLERGSFARNVSVKSIVANKSSESVYFGGIFEDVKDKAVITRSKGQRDEVQTISLSCSTCRHEVQVVTTSGNATLRSKVQVIKTTWGTALPSSGTFSLSIAGLSTPGLSYSVSANEMFTQLNAIVNVGANGGSEIVDVTRKEPDAALGRGYEWHITYAPYSCAQSGVSLVSSSVSLSSGDPSSPASISVEDIVTGGFDSDVENRLSGYFNLSIADSSGVPYLTTSPISPHATAAEFLQALEHAFPHHARGDLVVARTDKGCEELIQARGGVTPICCQSGLYSWSITYTSDRGNQATLQIDTRSLRGALANATIATRQNAVSLAGSFTLSFMGQVSVPIRSNASSSEVNAAIVGLSSSTGNISVTTSRAKGSAASSFSWNVTFGLPLGNVDQLVANTSGLHELDSGIHAGSISIEEIVPGARAGGIALWDGEGLTTLGGGVKIDGDKRPGSVNALALAQNGDLVVGGRFTHVGSVVTVFRANWSCANGSLPVPHEKCTSIECSCTCSPNMTGIAGRSLHAGNSSLCLASNATMRGSNFTSAINCTNITNATRVVVERSLHQECTLVSKEAVYTTTVWSAAENVARWIPALQKWAPLGLGLHGEVHALTVAPSTTANPVKGSGLGSVYAGGRFSITGDPYSIQEIQKIELHAAKVSEVQVVQTGLPLVNEVQTVGLTASWVHAIQEIEISADYIPEVQQVVLDSPRIAEVVRVNLLGMHVDEVQKLTVADSYVSETQVIGLCKDDQFVVLTGTFALTISEAVSVTVDASAAEMKTAIEGMQFMGSGSLIGVTVATTGLCREWRVTFNGASGSHYARGDVSAITVDTSGINGGGTVTVVESVKGVAQQLAGTFQLSYGSATTGSLQYNSEASVIESSIQALNGISDVSVSRTGPVAGTGAYEFKVTFVGIRDAGKRLQLTAGSGTALTGNSPTLTLAVVTEGQSVPMNGTFRLGHGNHTTRVLRHNSSAAEVENALLTEVFKVGAGSINVTREGPTAEDGYSFVITFVKEIAEKDPSLLELRNLSLLGAGAMGSVDTVHPRNHIRGTFDLGLGYVSGVARGLPYNISAAALQSALRGAFGAKLAAVSVTLARVGVRGERCWNVTFNNFTGFPPSLTVVAHNLTGTNVSAFARTAVPTNVISGTFALAYSLSGRMVKTTRQMESNVSAAVMKENIDALGIAGTVNVFRSGGSASTSKYTGAFKWRVIFRSVSDPTTLMVSNESNLTAAGLLFNITRVVEATTVNEIQKVTVDSDTRLGIGGTFKLRYAGQLTPSISADASANDVQDAIETIAAAGYVHVTKVGSCAQVCSWSVSFRTAQGNIAAMEVPLEGESFQVLPVGSTVSVTTDRDGTQRPGGTFRLRMPTLVGHRWSEPIPYSANASVLQQALHNAQSTDVAVSVISTDEQELQTWRIEFTETAGNLGFLEMDQSGLSGVNISSTINEIVAGTRLFGSFTLSYGTVGGYSAWVGPFTFNESAISLRDKLEQIPGIGRLNVSRTGGSNCERGCAWSITFTENVGNELPMMFSSNISGPGAFSRFFTETEGSKARGRFNVSLFGNTSSYLDNNVSAVVLKETLEAFDRVRAVDVSRAGPDGQGGFVWLVTFTSQFQLGDLKPIVLGFEPVNFTAEELESGVRGLNMSVTEFVRGRAAKNIARFSPSSNSSAVSFENSRQGGRSIWGRWSRVGKGFAFGTVHALQAIPSVSDVFVNAERVDQEHRLLVGGHLHYSVQDSHEGFAQKEVSERGLVYIGMADGTATSTATLSSSDTLDYVTEMDSGEWQNVGDGLQSSVGGAATGIVKSLHVTTSGALVVGGSFDRAGSTSAKNIAAISRYVDPISRRLSQASLSSITSSSWTNFEEGIEGEVQALSSDRFGNLYAGGVITRVGGYATSNTGRWNGARWAKMASGIAGEIRTVMVPPLPSVFNVEPNVISAAGGDTIFVTGPYFSEVGGAAVSNGESASTSVSAGGLELTVNVGPYPCTNVRWFSQGPGRRGVACEAPANTGTGIPVRVAAMSLVSNMNETAFILINYSRPIIHSLTVQQTPFSVLGGDNILINGKNFGGRDTEPKAFVGGFNCAQTQWYSDKQVLCVSPPGIGLNHNVSLIVGGQTAKRQKLDVNSSESLAISYAPPSVSGIFPSTVNTSGDTVVEIEGNGFGIRDPTLSGHVGGGLGLNVTIAGHVASKITWLSSSRIRCTAPAGIGKNRTVTVTIGEQIGSKRCLSYAVPEVILVKRTTTDLRWYKREGKTLGGTRITLKGRNFGLAQDQIIDSWHSDSNSTSTSARSVTVDGKPCTRLVTLSDTTLECDAPAGVGEGLKVLVSIGGRLSTQQNGFFSYDRPVLHSVVPAFGPTRGAFWLNVSGENLSPTETFAINRNETAWSVSVTIGDKECAPVVYVDGQNISCLVPPGSGKMNAVLIEVANQTNAKEPLFFNYSDPVIYSVSPSHGPESGSTEVTLRGVEFGQDARDIEIFVGGKAALQGSVRVIEHNTIEFLTPAHVGTQGIELFVGKVRARFSGSTATPFLEFTYDLCPPGTFTPGGSSHSLTGRVYSSPCRPCPLGQFSEIYGAGACLPCDKGSYQDELGQTYCKKCPNSSYVRFSASTALTDCLCAPGFFGARGSVCKECPRGAVCSGGELSMLPLVGPGYTRSHLNSEKLVECFPRAACSGGLASFRERAMAVINVSANVTAIVGPRIGPGSVTDYLKDQIDKRRNCSVACPAPLPDERNETENSEGELLSQCAVSCVLADKYVDVTRKLTVQITGDATATAEGDFATVMITGQSGPSATRRNINITDCPQKSINSLCVLELNTTKTETTEICSARCAAWHREGNCTMTCSDGFVKPACNLTCSEGLHEGLCDLECKDGYFEQEIQPNGFDEFCADGYTGFQCKECEYAHYRLKSRCVKCPDWSLYLDWPGVFISCVILAIFTFFTKVIWWTSQSYIPQPTFHIGFGFFVLTSALDRLRLDWPQPFSQVFSAASGFSFNPEWIGFECFSHISHQDRLRLAFCVPLMFGLCVLSLFLWHLAWNKSVGAAYRAAMDVLDHAFEQLELSRATAYRVHPEEESSGGGKEESKEDLQEPMTEKELEAREEEERRKREYLTDRDKDRERRRRSTIFGLKKAREEERKGLDQVDEYGASREEEKEEEEEKELEGIEEKEQEGGDDEGKRKRRKKRGKFTMKMDAKGADELKKRLRIKRAYEKKAEARKEAPYWPEFYLCTYVKILAILHTVMAAQALEVFSCQAQNDGTFLFRPEPTKACYGTYDDDGVPLTGVEWLGWYEISWAAFIGFCVLVPGAMYAVILSFHRGYYGLDWHSSSFQRVMGGVFKHYRRNSYYWEFVAMFERFLCVCIVTGPRTFDHVPQAACALLMVLCAYLFALLYFKPYAENCSGHILDTVCHCALIFGIIGGMGASFLDASERPVPYHELYIIDSPPPRAFNDMVPWGACQTMTFIGMSALVVGILAFPACLINDVLSSIGRGQRDQIIKSTQAYSVMMQLFPRSAKELRERLLEFPADLIRDFREDIAKLNEVYQSFHNINKNSKGRKGARRANFKGGALEAGGTAGRDTDAGEGPVSITMEQIALAGSGHLGEEGVGVNMEIFRWVLRGRRKEAKWCPGEILEFRKEMHNDEMVEEHKVKWVTPLGDVEEAWLNLMEESLKIPTMNTHKVIASHEAETKEQRNATFDSQLAARLKAKKAKMERQNEELASRIRMKAKAERDSRRNVYVSSTELGSRRRVAEVDEFSVLEKRIHGKLSEFGSGTLETTADERGGGGGGRGGSTRSLGNKEDAIIARLEKKTSGKSSPSRRGNVMDQLKRAQMVKQRRLREKEEAGGNRGGSARTLARGSLAGGSDTRPDEDVEGDPILQKLNAKLKERGGLGAAPSAKERDKQQRRKMLLNARRRTEVGLMKRGTKPILSPIPVQKAGSAPAVGRKLSLRDLGADSDSGSDSD